MDILQSNLDLFIERNFCVLGTFAFLGRTFRGDGIILLDIDSSGLNLSEYSQELINTRNFWSLKISYEQICDRCNPHYFNQLSLITYPLKALLQFKYRDEYTIKVLGDLSHPPRSCTAKLPHDIKATINRYFESFHQVSSCSTT